MSTARRARTCPSQDRRLYLARVPVAQLTEFSAWRFYAGAGTWAAGQNRAPAGAAAGPGGLSVSSGFSVVKAGQRYWLIQAGTEAGSPDIDAYPSGDAVGAVRPRRRNAAVPGPGHRARRGA